LPAILVILLAACASVPKIPESPLEQRIPLDEGATAYIFVDVPEARPVLDHVNIEGYSSAQVASILDKTRFAVAGLYPAESGRGVRAVTWGNYPRTRAGLAFGMSKEWKRQRSAAGKSYWYSAGHGLSVALESGQSFVAVAPAAVRNNPAAREAWEAAELAAGPFARGPGIEAPEGFNAFREGAFLALWMDRPAESLDRFFGALRVPIRIPAEQLMAGLSTLPPPDADTADADEQNPGTVEPEAGRLYELKLRIKVPSEANARTLMTLLSTARIFIFGAGNQGGIDQETFELLNLFFARPPEREGDSLILRCPPLDENGVALLFNLFSVYSQEKPVTP
jgi:hypothetical protein